MAIESPLTIQVLKAETGIPVIIVDHEGIVVHINHSFERNYGWQKDFLIGKTLTTIIPETLRSAHHLGFSRFKLTSDPKILNQPLNLSIVMADGSEAVAEHFIIAEKINGDWVFGATITPAEQSQR